MKIIKNIVGGAIIGSLLSTTALAHTNSVGYVGDGSGGLNFWYGSWHDNTTFNEAEIKIEGTDANGTAYTWSDGNGGTQTYSIDAFNLLSQDSPAGLISGVNYFTSDGTQLIPYDPSDSNGGGESYTWQGMNYTNLAPGDYTFTYIPLQDAESTICPAGTSGCGPTQDWVPMDNVILSLGVTITQNDLNGDANNNGILDINEVAVGAASGGPTVVGTGSSSATAYSMGVGADVQTITAATTVTMWNEMSDGTQDGHHNMPTTYEYSTGRVDQADQMIGLKVHRSTGIADGIATGRISHDMGNGYSAETRTYSLGHTTGTDNGMLVGGGLTRSTTTLTGEHSDGSMNTTTLQVRVGKALDNRDATVSVSGHLSNSDLTYNRTIGNFSAAGETSARDVGITAMLEKSTGNVRPFAGATVGKKTLDAWDETGDVQAAMSHIATDETYRYATLGFNVDTGVLTASVSKDFGDSDATRIGLGIDRAINERVSISASANRLLDGDNTSTYMSAGIKINF